MGMPPEDLRRAQLCMLHILKKVHEICTKHNIKYWLDFGTLLGAIRHDGFIPWDDDLDISMMREDYEKWNKIAQKELGEEFFWQTEETEPDYHLFFGKVRLNQTLWLESPLINSAIKHTGIYIDIFPVDFVPKNKVFLSFYQKIYGFGTRVLWKKFLKNDERNLFVKIGSMLNSTFFRKLLMFITKIMNELCRKYVSILYTYTQKYFCAKSDLRELVLHKFEDGEFYIPKKYDAHLTRIYGNYMQLPPENKRSGAHNVIDYDFGKYHA